MKTIKSGQFRKKKIYFTQVSNVALRDSSLSLKAKGLYSLIQSYLTIEDFTLYKNTLKKHLKEGEKAFESAWKELKDAAYLIQYRLQDPKTKQFYYEYELLDEPNIELAKKTHNSQNRKKHEEKKQPPKNVDRIKKAIPTKKEGMGNVHSGKVGVYNNTELNNTELNNTISTSTTPTIDNLYCLFEKGFNKKPSIYMKKKLNNFANQTSLEFVIEVLNYCIERNANSASYLFKTLEKLIDKNLITVDLFKESIQKYYKNIGSKSFINKRRDNKYISSSKVKVNFTQREYDYENLEKALLGWI